jgi:ribosomal protein L37AE/L43A
MQMPKPSEPGKVRCLQCGKSFMSKDKVRIRRCSKCKKTPRDWGRAAEGTYRTECNE